MWCALTFVIAVRRPPRRVCQTDATEEGEEKENGELVDFSSVL